MKSSYKTGQQRRTNQKKLKRTKEALERRKAQRDATTHWTYDDKQQKYVEVNDRRAPMTRWARFKKWVGGLFSPKPKTKLREVDFDEDFYYHK